MEWLVTGETKGDVYSNRQWNVKHASFAKTIPIGVDTLVRRSRNPDKLRKEAQALLEAQPWLHDPNLDPALNLRVVMNHLNDFPFRSLCAEANDCKQTTPFWIIHDRMGNVLFRFTSHLTDCRMRDVLLPYLMGVQAIEPLITVEYRNKKLEEYKKRKQAPVGALRGEVVVHHDGKPMTQVGAK